jgi:hypothetical protein
VYVFTNVLNGRLGVFLTSAMHKFTRNMAISLRISLAILPMGYIALLQCLGVQEFKSLLLLLLLASLVVLLFLIGLCYCC